MAVLPAQTTAVMSFSLTWLASAREVIRPLMSSTSRRCSSLTPFCSAVIMRRVTSRP